jgi:hypothetical protein
LSLVEKEKDNFGKIKKKVIEKQQHFAYNRLQE